MKQVPLRWNKKMVYLQQWIGHWSLLPMILGFTSAQPMSFHLHFIHLKAWEPEHLCFIQSFWDGSVMQHLAVWKGGYPKTSTTESASSELSSQLQAAEDMQTSKVGLVIWGAMNNKSSKNGWQQQKSQLQSFKPDFCLEDLNSRKQGCKRLCLPFFWGWGEVWAVTPCV